MTEISIEFDNGGGVFVPGHEVSGTVILTLKEAVKANSVIVTLTGEARTHWGAYESKQRYISPTDRNGNHPSGNHSSVDTYRDPVPFDAHTPNVDEKRVVWSPSPDQSNIPSGTHRFPFSFLLPVKCPVTFEGTFGFIRYYCVAKIDRSWIKGDKCAKQVFTVIPPVDLNRFPNGNLPIEVTEVKKIGGLFFKNGSIQLKMRLNKAGFIPGESIVLNADIANSSSQKINNIRFKILQLSHYSAYRGGGTIMPGKINKSMFTMEESREVFTSEEKLEIAKGATEKIVRSIPIPSVVASFKNCPIIRVEYFVEMILATGGPVSSNVSAQIPVTIGTIPIRERTMEAMSPESPCNDNQWPHAPPSYTDCVFEAGTMKDREETSAFTPRYAYYDNKTSAAMPAKEKL